MKLLRRLLLTTLVLVVVALTVAVLAMSPRVQTWLVQHWLRRSGSAASVESVQLQWQHATLRGVVWQGDGWRLRAPEVQIDMPLLSALQKRAELHRLVSRKWILELAPNFPPLQVAAAQRSFTQLPLAAIGQSEGEIPVRDSQTEPATLFRGWLRALELPVDFSADEVDLEGDIYFRVENSRPPIAVHVSAVGGNLRAGQAGTFRLKTDWTWPARRSPVDMLIGDSELTLNMDTPRTFDAATLKSAVVAAGPTLPGGARLRITCTAARAPEGETYRFDLSRGGTTAKELLHGEGAFVGSRQRYEGEWRANMRREDVSAFSLGYALPDFSAQGSGQCEADPALTHLHALGKIQADVAHLDHLWPWLAAVGPLHCTGDFELLKSGTTLRLDQLALDLSGAQPVLSLQALQAFGYDLKSGEFQVEKPDADLLRAQFDGVPFAWFAPWLRDVSVDADELKGALTARARQGGIVIRSIEPFTLHGLSISRGGRLWLDHARLDADFLGEYSPRQGWTLNVSTASLQSRAGTPFFRADGKIGRLAGVDQPIKATAEGSLNLPAAATQPACTWAVALRSGLVNLDLTAILAGDAQQFAIKANFRGAATEPLPDIDVSARLDRMADAELKIQAPVTVAQFGRKSDLLIAADLVPSDAGTKISAQISGQKLYWNDLGPLIAALTAPASGAGATARIQNANTPPWWTDDVGRVQFAFASVPCGATLRLDNLKGEIDLGAGAGVTANLAANLEGGGRAAAQGDLRFQRTGPTPYAVQAQVNLDNVDPAPWLSTLSRTHQPTIEGRLDVNAEFSAQTDDLAKISDALNADVKVTSRGGKFRGFAASAAAADLERYQRALGTITSLFQAAENWVGYLPTTTAERVRAALDAVNRFTEIDFDQLSFELQQRPNAATKLENFSLISPDIRLVGDGELADEPRVNWLERPLHLNLNIAVRGEQASSLRKLGLLKPEKDALGYFPLTDPILIDGTLTRMSATDLDRLFTRMLPRGG